MGGAEHLDSGGAGLRVGLCSFGLLRAKHLPVFLGLEQAKFSYAFSGNAKAFDLFIGWGRKPSGQRALRLSQEQDRPFLLLEDGFLRSLHPNSVIASDTMSLAVDDAGIFYDAQSPSRLETLITQSDAGKEEGAHIICMLRDNQLSKYNFFPDKLDPEIESHDADRQVLVVDQTAGDLSIKGAGARGSDFKLMLEAARDENPGSRILIKSHPETMAGKRGGYLSSTANSPDCHLLTKRINPWHLLEHVSRVYVVSSQLGLDALMAKKQVRCFGMPFYAGWGLTKDEKPCERRQDARPSLEQLVAATYGQYCRYLDPYTRTRTTFAKAAGTLTNLKDVSQRGQELGPFVNIYPWTRKSVRAMFQLSGRRQDFFIRPAKAIAYARKHDLPVTSWAARTKPALEQQCAASGVRLHKGEDGFIRSVGLGSNFHQPMSLVLDKTGIHYDSGKPSDLETLLQTYEFDDELRDRARALIGSLKAEDITKYNLAGAEKVEELPQDQLKILVPGQVENDASVLHSGSPLKKSVDLLRAVREANPDAFIVFKPHPDVMSGQRPGLWKHAAADGLADVFLPDVPIVEAMAACDQVHVLSSLAGFEGLLRGKQVTCYGMPFYAGWGLTTDVISCGRRRRKLTLEELVAGSMILYPDYLDPVTQLPCDPETVIHRILEQRAKPQKQSPLVVSREAVGYFRRILRLVQR